MNQHASQPVACRPDPHVWSGWLGFSSEWPRWRNWYQVAFVAAFLGSSADMQGRPLTPYVLRAKGRECSNPAAGIQGDFVDL